MITWFKRKKVSPMQVAPGDTVRVHYIGDDNRHEVISHAITETGEYDTLAIGKIENEIGFEEAIVGGEVIFPLLKFWTYTPWGWLAAIVWNCCELAGVRCPFAPTLFGWIIGCRGKKEAD